MVANHVWAQELALWPIALDLAVATGTPAKRRAALDARVVVINYENLVWLTQQDVWPEFDGIVWDEVSKMKSAGSRRTTAMRRKMKNIRWTCGLTGTPISTGIADLYAQLKVIDGGRALGKNLETFRHRYLMLEDPYAPWPTWVEQPGALERIQSDLEPVVYRIPEEVYRAQLPPLTVTPVYSALGDEAMREYKEMVRDLVIEVGDDLIESHASQKLQQLASGFIYNEAGEAIQRDTSKMDSLEPLLHSEPTLVFYNYQAELETMMARFGGEPLDIERWNRGEQMIAYAHPLSAGHGLNLQSGGRHIVWLAPPWSAELWTQANGRLLRSGQERAVFVHVLVSRDTIEVQMSDRLAERQQLAESFI